MDQDIVVRTIGRRRDIPDRVLKEMDKTIQMSSHNSGTCLCLAINYGGRGELVDAIPYARFLQLRARVMHVR